METIKKRSKKKASATVAIVLIIALLLTGTLALVVQTAMNIFKNTAGATDIPGVLLHDDFDEKNPFVNKDVYVENTGDVDIFVRIRLDEMMVVGSSDPTKASGWKTNFPTVLGPGSVDFHCGETGNDVSSGTTTPLKFHDVFEWKMGTDETTYYRTGQSAETGTNAFARDLRVYTQADYDACQADRDAYFAANGFYVEAVQSVPHAGYNVVSLLYYDTWTEPDQIAYTGWIYDQADGIAYWSQPLEPGTATAFLLDQVTIKPEYEDKDYYYAINVIMEAVTRDEEHMWRINPASAPTYPGGGAAPRMAAVTLDTLSIEEPPVITSAIPTAAFLGRTTNPRMDYYLPFIFGRSKNPGGEVTPPAFPPTGEVKSLIGNVSVDIYLEIDETFQVELKPEVTEKITWVSKEEAIATVSEDGLVTGISPGKTEIYAILPNGDYDFFYAHVAEPGEVTPPNKGDLEEAIRIVDEDLTPEQKATIPTDILQTARDVLADSDDQDEVNAADEALRAVLRGIITDFTVEGIPSSFDEGQPFDFTGITPINALGEHLPTVPKATAGAVIDPADGLTPDAQGKASVTVTYEGVPKNLTVSVNAGEPTDEEILEELINPGVFPGGLTLGDEDEEAGEYPNRAVVHSWIDPEEVISFYDYMVAEGNEPPHPDTQYCWFKLSDLFVGTVVRVDADTVTVDGKTIDFDFGANSGVMEIVERDGELFLRSRYYPDQESLWVDMQDQRFDVAITVSYNDADKVINLVHAYDGM